jgi:hypothetical protein
VISWADVRSGILSNTLGPGGSVAKARAANVSWTRLTQSNWTAVRTGLFTAVRNRSDEIKGYGSDIDCDLELVDK